MKKRSVHKLGKAIADDDDDIYCCPLPFEHVYSDSAGRWRLCCRAYPFEHTVSDTTPEEHLQHPLRYGSHFDEVIANIERAKECPPIRVVVSCATGILSAGDVHDVAEFFHRRNITAKFNMCVITGPTFLQARHLPDELKQEYLGRIESSPYREQFKNVIRMVKQPRDDEQFRTFLRYINDLDQHRGTSYLQLWPEFAPWSKEHLGEPLDSPLETNTHEAV